MKDDHGTILAIIHVLTFMVLPTLFLLGAVYLLSIFPGRVKFNNSQVRCISICAPYVYANYLQGDKCVCDKTKELR